MERMDMHSRNEYLKVLREKYLRAKTKKEKSLILDEYCQREKLEFTRSRPNRKNDNACLRQTMLILNRKTGSMTGKSWVI